MFAFDKKLKGNLRQYIIQCLIATVSLMGALMYMDIVLKTAVVASIGATSFIIFTMPHNARSRSTLILGGYVISSCIGVTLNLVLINSGIPINLVGSIAVGISMFIMVITDLEHPPAAALALGVAIEGYSFNLLVFVFGVTSMLLFIKWILRRWLIDLL